jgi:hypothetical protein
MFTTAGTKCPFPFVQNGTPTATFPFKNTLIYLNKLGLMAVVLNRHKNKQSGDLQWHILIYRVITNDVRDYINLFVRKTQKLNVQRCKEQLRKFFITYARSVCAPFVALHTSDDIRLRDEHFKIKADQFFQSLFLFDPSSCLGL